MAWGDKSAITGLFRWYSSNAGRRVAFLQDAKPAPVLVLEGSTNYWWAIRAVSGSFALFLGDNFAGTIPTEQLLGAFAEPPLSVFRHAAETALQFGIDGLARASTSQQQVGPRWFIKAAKDLGIDLGFGVVVERAEAVMWDHNRSRSEAEPDSVIAYFKAEGKKAEGRGDRDRAVEAYLYAASAGEAVWSPDRMDFTDAGSYAYECALRNVDPSDTRTRTKLERSIARVDAMVAAGRK